MRFLVECTYVYEHPHVNSGIQRVVRNVINNLEQAHAPECIPVILTPGEIYRVNQLQPDPDQKFKSRVHAWLTRQHNRLGRLRERTALYRASLREGNFSIVRSVKQLACLVMQLALRVVMKCLSWMSLNYADTNRLEPLTYKPGDVLILLDSSWHADFFPMAERLKSEGVKIVAVIYDLIPLTHPQFCDDGLVRVFDHWFDWITRTADGYVAISRTIIEQVRGEVCRRLGEDAAQQRWFDYFHLGSDLDQIAPNSTVRPEVESVFRQRPVYLMVSTIEPRKNHAYLLDAFDQLWSANRDVALCFVGKIGWKTERLIERIRQHPQLGQRLFMLNDLNDRELEHCYLHARSLVFPSHVEGFGLPLVEAMQRNLPVMASDIPVFREIGENSMAYFDLSDPGSLVQLVIQFEDSGQFPTADTADQWRWQSWQEATVQLIARVQTRTRAAAGG